MRVFFSLKDKYEVCDLLLLLGREQSEEGEPIPAMGPRQLFTLGPKYQQEQEQEQQRNGTVGMSPKDCPHPLAVPPSLSLSLAET